MPVQIQIPTPMRQHTGGLETVEATGSTVQDVFRELGAHYPGIAKSIFENGSLRRFVNVYLNDEDIRYLENLETPVKDGDSISIIPAVAGG